MSRPLYNTYNVAERRHGTPWLSYVKERRRLNISRTGDEAFRRQSETAFDRLFHH
jgi:hypothetical protein